MNNTYRINIAFNVDLGINAPAHLQQALQYFLQDWSDGRYNFSSELIQHGLVKAVEAATEKAIRQEKWMIHGDQMVSTATGKIIKKHHAVRHGATSLTSLETDKAIKGVSVHIVGDLECTGVAVAPEIEPCPQD